MSDEPHGLAFVEAVSAEDLGEGQIVVLDGHVLEAGPDPDDSARMRLVIVPALHGHLGRVDQREIILSIPRGMKLSTAKPFNTEPVPPPPRL
jgi:hypothetical protein